MKGYAIKSASQHKSILFTVRLKLIRVLAIIMTRYATIKFEIVRHPLLLNTTI